jgi:hypothetical protein
MTIGLTPYLTPQMLLSSNYGISWGTFPRVGATPAEQVSAQLDICHTVTAEMDTLASLTLRATVDPEMEFGPDFIITILPNGWARFRLSNWPILQVVSAQVSPASSTPPTWTSIPSTSLTTEHAGLSLTGSIVPSGAGPGPTAVLIAPNYVDWQNGRKGYLVQVTTINGFPVAGMDATVHAGDHSIHVDDITGWWNGTSGARGTIYDPPYREPVVVGGATPDTAGAISGPGTLTLTSPLQFSHTPSVGGLYQADQRILLSAMPSALLQAGFYLATYYGLIRGATGAVVQAARGQAAPSGVKAAGTWREAAIAILERYARVF